MSIFQNSEMKLTTLTCTKLTLMKRSSTFNNSEEEFFLSMRTDFNGKTLNVKGGATKEMVEVKYFYTLFYIITWYLDFWNTEIYKMIWIQKYSNWDEFIHLNIMLNPDFLNVYDLERKILKNDKFVKTVMNRIKPIWDSWLSHETLNYLARLYNSLVRC